jgi:hypothetical protein
LLDRLAELIRQGIALARQAAGDRLWVAPTLGRRANCWSQGDLPSLTLKPLYAEQIEIVAEAGPIYF